MIGGQAPSEYLEKLQSHKQVQLSADGMNRILASHRIRAVDLRHNDFDVFFLSRREGLLEVIERAMGKLRGDSPEGESVSGDSDDKEEDSSPEWPGQDA
jgi:hypothetical protein